MIKFMDEITEALTEAVRAYMEWAGEIAIYMAKGLILLSTPVWILPYMMIRDILRDTNGGKCESPDCDSCPFPPCRKGEGEQ